MFQKNNIENSKQILADLGEIFTDFQSQNGGVKLDLIFGVFHKKLEGSSSIIFEIKSLAFYST